ncbi:purine-cytosine permease fcy22 protein [Apiospora marii]|uniref:Purine-cytosine permease fcy22 protein n=1 Tax=Apiospora marii TaxID=335849 RepID=A0ABR1S8J3_9PEZI
MASEIPHEKDAHLHEDVEAGTGNRKHGGGLSSFLAVEDGVVYKPGLESNPRWYQRLLDAGVEDNGVKPVPVESRTDTRYHNLFTVFSTALLCVLPIPTGMLGTTAFGMSLRDASLTILFFSLLCSIPPAYMGCGGYKTGMRQLVQARYSWGLYIVTLPLLLNAATVTGFTLISAIVGGQTIAAINPGHVSVDVGIIITILIGFGVSFLGFRALHAWERWSWIPNLIALVITVGCGGKFLVNQAQAEPVTAPQVVSYAGLIAGYFITFGGTASDYSVYYNPKASKVKIFSYIYLGLLTPSVPLLILGAAMGGAVPVVEGWSDAYDAYGAGGVLAAMLEPAHGFGKFVLVLLALSVLGQLAISMYSIALNLQMLVPIFTKVPRYAFIVVVSVVMIPIGIKVAEQWETSLENFLALIGYWAGCFDAVLLEEFLVFRRRDYATYDHAIWNVGGKLPSGVAALAASLLSMGLVIPGMAEAWYTGPIAEKTGDIGFEMAFFVTAVFYLPFRWLEIKWRGHL